MVSSSLLMVNLPRNHMVNASEFSSQVAASMLKGWYLGEDKAAPRYTSLSVLTYP
jgi:hypothetical protein